MLREFRATWTCFRFYEPIKQNTTIPRPCVLPSRVGKLKMRKRTCCALCVAQQSDASSCIWQNLPGNSIPWTVITWLFFNQNPNKIISEEQEIPVLLLDRNYSDAKYCPCNSEWMWGLGSLGLVGMVHHVQAAGEKRRRWG